MGKIPNNSAVEHFPKWDSNALMIILVRTLILMLTTMMTNVMRVVVVVVSIAGRQAVPTDVGGWSGIIVPNHQTLATTSRSVQNPML